MNRTAWAASALAALGCVQAAGDVLGWQVLRAVGAASHASPAPKVFTAQDGFETYANRFYLEWRERDGSRASMELAPKSYAALQGPYNRRNAYGAAVSYGPVLVADPRTEPMLRAVISHALCGDAPLLQELGLGERAMPGSAVIRLEPRAARPDEPKRRLSFEADCRG